MRDTIIGLGIGVTIGIVFGVFVIAPGLEADYQSPIDEVIAEIPVPSITPRVTLVGETWRIPPRDPSLPETDQTLITRGFAAIDQATGGALHAREALKSEHSEDWTSPYDAILSGEIDAAIAEPGAGEDLAPVLALFGAAPFGPQPRELTAWLYAGDGNRQLAAIHADLGLHAIPCAIKTSGAAGWFRNAVAKPADLDGLRMRIEGLAAEAASKLGVEAVPFENSQLLAAFRTGRLDAAEISTPADDQALSLHEGAHHYMFPGWQAPATLMVLLTRLETWDSLPEIRRMQIALACGDNVRHGIAKTEAQQYEVLRHMIDQGVEISRMPEDVIQAFSLAWHDVAIEKASADKAFSDVWQSLQTFRADYAIWQEISAQ